MPEAVERAIGQGAAALLALRRRARDMAAQAVGEQVGERREEQDEHGQTPVVVEQHGDVGHHDDAGVEELCRELPHALDASIDVGDDLRHETASILTRNRRLRHLDEILVEPRAHGQADMVGKLAHVEALYVAGALHTEDCRQIAQAEPVHVRRRLFTLHDVVETLRQLAVEPRAGQHADIVDEPADRDDAQHLPLLPEIRAELLPMLRLLLGLQCDHLPDMHVFVKILLLFHYTTGYHRNTR